MNLLSKNVKKYTPKGTLHKEECGLNFLSFFKLLRTQK